MKHLLYILATGMMLAGCIKNDIPYPTIHANFTAISAKGQTRSAQIDSVQNIVTFYFGETADIYNVTISDYQLTPKAFVSEGNLDEPINLSEPYSVTLSLYQDYQWTLQAVQPIDRYFSVASQIGASEIDTDNHTVKAYVSKRTPLDAIVVESFKIAPTSAVVTPNLAGTTVDFSHPVEVQVENYGHKEMWTISVEHSNSTVTTLSADGWTCVAWVYGEAEIGHRNTIQYRIKGNTEWITVPEAWLTSDGGNFYARITGLTPETHYEARAISDSEAGETLEFTTGKLAQMPDSNFDQWWLNGKVWCPWPEDGTPFWGTGNRGATTLGPSNTVPTDDTVDGQGQAAMLQTKFVGIGMLGKLAAGNIFAGSYVRTDGTNGVLSMGREFSERPTKLTGFLKYKSTEISNTSTGFEYLKGRPDTCTVWIALIDSEEPYEIRTNPKNQQLFDPENPCVIAYGQLQYGYDIDEYIPFEIELSYRSTSRVPKYILCTASASKYGDYFTGGNGSVMCVDNFELSYDY